MDTLLFGQSVFTMMESNLRFRETTSQFALG
ncbi:Uncharacterised protein [Citrobacter freundii]|nr:Uncharacterised protein [Citrobacter freundii]